MSVPPLPETEKFLAGISAAVRAVLARKFPSLNAPEREDIEQDVRLKIWRMMRDGKKIDRLESYLWKVVYTTALDLLDGKWNEVPLEITEDGRRPSAAAVETPEGDPDLRIDLENRIESLRENRRLVLKLHLAGFDRAETAARLGWSEAKVRHLYYRGLSDLKRMAREEGKRSLIPARGEYGGRR